MTSSQGKLDKKKKKKKGEDDKWNSWHYEKEAENNAKVWYGI